MVRINWTSDNDLGPDEDALTRTLAGLEGTPLAGLVALKAYESFLKLDRGRGVMVLPVELVQDLAQSVPTVPEGTLLLYAVEGGARADLTHLLRSYDPEQQVVSALATRPTFERIRAAGCVLAPQDELWALGVWNSSDPTATPRAIYERFH